MIKDVRITVRHVIVEVYVQDNKKVKICFLPNDSFIDTTVLTKKLFQSTGIYGTTALNLIICLERMHI